MSWTFRYHYLACKVSRSWDKWKYLRVGTALPRDSFFCRPVLPRCGLYVQKVFIRQVWHLFQHIIRVSLSQGKKGKGAKLHYSGAILFPAVWLIRAGLWEAGTNGHVMTHHAILGIGLVLAVRTVPSIRLVPVCVFFLNIWKRRKICLAQRRAAMMNWATENSAPAKIMMIINTSEMSTTSPLSCGLPNRTNGVQS